MTGQNNMLDLREKITTIVFLSSGFYSKKKSIFSDLRYSLEVLTCPKV